MKKHSITALCAAILSASLITSSGAAAKKPVSAKTTKAASAPVSSPAIPYFPGAQVLTELTLPKDTLLAVVQDLLNSSGAGDAGASSASPPKDRSWTALPLMQILAQVDGLYYLEIALQPGAPEDAAHSFYTRFPESRKMTRIYRSAKAEMGTLELWSGSGGAGLYGVMLIPRNASDPTSVTLLRVARVDGYIDARKLLSDPNVQSLIEQTLAKK
ncbi:MAG: hypothetical protein IT209_03405 [Armatimonadetes bacterium]|nr:hypothetical protein [Armatimonadota bacterium]